MIEDDFYVTSQLSEINIPWVIEHLRATYFASWRSPELITESLHNSICFGLFERMVLPEVSDGKSHKDTQVGFARVVTDYATFSWICDVYIAPAHRGRGLGRFLLNTVSEDHRVKPTVQLLRCKQQVETFYTRGGFNKVTALRKIPGQQ